MLEAVAPLAAERPAVVAFGTAERASLAAALDSLAALGVARAAVVRLFVSGAAWAERTRWLLGLSDRPPSARSGEGAAEP
ncbi:MAG TPA: hypothetical protein VFQ22_14050, partial [Longimicrobiales bacterium]|nr:hypothetical protein [Longimicrobiales bacterium]